MLVLPNLVLGSTQSQWTSQQGILWVLTKSPYSGGAKGPERSTAPKNKVRGLMPSPFETY